MDDQAPTRAQAIMGLARETILFILAFTAGAGLYLAGVSADPIRWQDWAGAAAAGANTCLLRMFPTAARRARGGS